MSQVHFSFEITLNQIGVLKLADGVNVLSQSVLEELESHCDHLLTNSQIQGLVITSHDNEHFILGADIKDIESLRRSPQDPEQNVEAGARYMQEVFQKIADLQMSTVCAIHGACLGGGCELALACDYRVASSDSSTKFGFPEVQLGLIPGAGGTQRLPRLIGLIPSIELITSAKKISAQKAAKLGLVDGVVGSRQLLDLAIRFAHSSTRPVRSQKKPKSIKKTCQKLAIEKNPIARKLIFRAARTKIEKQTSGFYPAPVKALTAIREGYQLPLNLGLKKEAATFAELAMSSVSLALTHLFHATTHIKKSPYHQNRHDQSDHQPASSPSSADRDSHSEPSTESSADKTTHNSPPQNHAENNTEHHRADQSTGDIHHNSSPEDIIDHHQEQSSSEPPPDTISVPPPLRVGIVGAGFMGSGIATLCASRGLSCRLLDPSPEAISKAYGYVSRYLKKRLAQRRIKSFEMKQALMRISAVSTQNENQNHADSKDQDSSLDPSGMARCSVVIEAVHESLSLKQKILRDLESQAHEDWVFASNTSALPISDIAAVAQNPARVIGMHFFSPAEKMPLCEIVKTITSDDSAVSAGFELATQMGKQVIVVRDGPGFYTTRTLAFFLAESIRLLEQGARVEDIDKAMKQFGFPVGPLTLLDEVGLDVGSHVLSTMVKAFPGRIYESQNVSKMIDKNYLGRKSSQGLYVYSQAKSSRSGDLKKTGVNQEIYQIFGSSAGSISLSDIQKRLSLVFVNESIKCLEDEILAHPYDGDVGAVFGLGFPPFLGGPFYYADTLGAQNLIDELTELTQELGQSYKPSALLQKKALEQRKFYEDQ